MLGEFVDDYTVRVVDVFAMPQSGTGVSVEAVDPVFQTKMLDMLKQVGRSVTAGCWLPPCAACQKAAKSQLALLCTAAPYRLPLCYTNAWLQSRHRALVALIDTYRH